MIDFLLGATRTRPKVEECIQEIVQIAQADNGALTEGDSPEASRHELPEVRMAAQDLLETLYSSMDGCAIRTKEEVLQAMTTPIRRRQKYIDTLAKHSLRVLYATWPLSEKDMDAAVKQWKHDFPMKRKTLKKINGWEKEGTRASKRDANKLRNGAFAVYLREECIAKQLAMSFLKFPSTRIHDLLYNWAQYMKSPEHMREKNRAERLDPDNAEAVREKERQIALKLKVHSLRHMVRQMKRLHSKNILYSQMSEQEEQQYKKWRSGKMEQELQVLTEEHGYGKLPLNQSMLLPTRCPDQATYNL